MSGKILMVDDVPLFLEIQKGFLRMTPIAILTAKNGAEGLEVARRERPDLIFMDLHMPIMDGAEACRRIKGDPELGKTPVVMVTTADRLEDQHACQAAGCNDYITKPVDKPVFLHVARQYLPSIDRRDKRVPLRQKARFKMHGVTMTAELADVSQNGVFLAAAFNATIGADVEVSFVLPGEETREIVAAGSVIWVNTVSDPKKSKLPAGFGVHLKRFAPGCDKLLADYVERA